MTRSLLAPALILAIASSTAQAERITVRYDFPERAGIAFSYGFFGGERGPTTGHILSTTLVMNYTTTGDQDAADLYLTFDVPTFDGVRTHIGLTGTDLGWSGQDTFHYSFTSEDYNGEIRPGRFGAEFDGGGTFTDSYIEFEVEADPIDAIFAYGFDEI